ncbi:RNA-directed DNA polymerase, eukaryota, reverse transcriptase zinc-binding domain protein [Tanacetum coccineum]
MPGDNVAIPSNAVKTYKRRRQEICDGVRTLKENLQLLINSIKVWSKEAKIRSNKKKIDIQHNLSDIDKIIDQGDENTKYFHGILNKKRSQLAICGTLVNGEWISDLDRLSSDQVEDLERIVTYGEVKRAVWDCGANKLYKVGGNMSRINSWEEVITKVWRFFTQESSWWTCFIKAIHGNQGALDTCKFTSRRSPWLDIIRDLHSLKSKGTDLMQFIRKKVGNGENNSFWDETWLGDDALKSIYLRLFVLEAYKSISVAEKLSHSTLVHSFCRLPRGGVKEEQHDLLRSRIVNVILPNMIDRWIWTLEASGMFTVKSTRNHIDDNILPKVEVPTRWFKVIPIKVNILAWRVCLDKIPSRLNISIRGIEIPSILCPLCNSAVESTSHNFFSCPLARQVRSKILRWWELDDTPINSYGEWLNWLVNIRLPKQLKTFKTSKGRVWFKWEVNAQFSSFKAQEKKRKESKRKVKERK